MGNTREPAREPAGQHREWQDRCLKRLFGHPEVIRDLLAGFVLASRSHEFNFSTLRLLPTNWVKTDLRQSVCDCAWRVDFRDRSGHLIALVEFQSQGTADMIFRLWGYALGQYESSYQQAGSWVEPEMVTVVLYSGRSKWPGLRSVGKGRRRSRWQPILEYFLLQLLKYRRDRLPPDNLISYLVALWQTHQDRKALQRYLGCLIIRLEEIGKNALAESFYVWLREVLAMHQEIDALVDPKLPALEKLKRLRDAVVDWDDPDWARQWVAEGHREGRAKGHWEGRTKGHREGRAEGRREGRAEERAEILDVIREEVRSEAEEKFGPETAEQLAGHLARLSDPGRLMKIAKEIHEGASYATLLKRLSNGHANEA